MVIKLLFVNTWDILSVRNLMKRFSRGFRKYIRKEKARIRREALTLGEERKMIEQLCQRINEMFQEKHKDKELVLSN